MHWWNWLYSPIKCMSAHTEISPSLINAGLPEKCVVLVLVKTCRGITEHASYIMWSLLHLVFFSVIDFRVSSLWSRQPNHSSDHYTNEQLFGKLSRRVTLDDQNQFSKAVGIIKQEWNTFTWHFLNHKICEIYSLTSVWGLYLINERLH